MDERTFRDEASRDGYADPVLIEWEAGTFNDTHTHEFAARIFVLSGEMTVKTPERETTCGGGDSEGLEFGVPHSERIGPEGVRFLVARKS